MPFYVYFAVRRGHLALRKIKRFRIRLYRHGLKSRRGGLYAEYYGGKLIGGRGYTARNLLYGSKCSSSQPTRYVGAAGCSAI